MIEKPALHPEFQPLEDFIAKRNSQLTTKLSDIPVSQYRGMYAMAQPAAPEIEVGRVEEVSFPGPDSVLRVRIYTPKGSGPFPVVVYYHGGGFTLGGLDTHDAPCRLMCQLTGCMVVSVDYRLVPEHPYPAFRDDCYAALVWIAENAQCFGGDPERLAVAGDSAGGLISANVAIEARDKGGPRISFQLIIVGALDSDLSSESCQLRQYAMLTLESAKFFNKYIFSDPSILEEEGKPRLPLYFRPADNDLKGLPPAMVLVAECDFLFEVGKIYAEKLDSAGVAVEFLVGEGMPHQFTSLAHKFPSARVYFERACAALSRALAEE
ncbi:alpha/beta hydrolase [Pseudomaricurvus alkylphenolicus]|uniref:alpha/beta hydrolase n=1 Tax=Pseudomaricurvus alkylphenolicus TaxID=1306991 RepID=UPI00141F630B|nr:alpha/beta hydrolase [Pseudomaricurvus alkylphenolicus]NIB38174.1 alpha/beta hydrolase [Pseudomaricurvus alkylphenolicus]